MPASHVGEIHLGREDEDETGAPLLIDNTGAGCGPVWSLLDYTLAHSRFKPLLNGLDVPGGILLRRGQTGRRS
jgi:uncharacterized protein (UPF0276 family)